MPLHMCLVVSGWLARACVASKGMARGVRSDANGCVPNYSGARAVRCTTVVCDGVEIAQMHVSHLHTISVDVIGMLEG